MDIEAPIRRQLLSALDGNFLAFEEVELSHCVFPSVRLRADVVAIPIDSPIKHLPLAFEVEKAQAGDESKYTEWCYAIKQAADYVFAEIMDDRLSAFRGRRIGGALVFPAPGLPPSSSDGTVDRDTYHLTSSSGAFHLGQHFGVGRATHSSQSALQLMLGPTVVFSGSRCSDGVNRVLKPTRPIGSRMVDVYSKLGGLDGNFTPYEFE